MRRQGRRLTKHGRTAVRAVGVVVVAALLVQTTQGAQGAPGQAAAAGSLSTAAKPDPTLVVPSKPVSLGRGNDEAPMPDWVAPVVTWPEDASRSVSVNPGSAREAVSVVSVADPRPATDTGPGLAFDVAVKGRDAAEVVGGIGTVFSLGRAASPSSGGLVTVTVDTSGFAGAVGAGFASRVALFRVSECAAVAVAAAKDLAGSCAPDLERVPSTLDLATGLLTAHLPIRATDEGSGSGGWDDLSGATTSNTSLATASSSTYTLSSTTSGPEGDFSAPPTTIAGSWTSGGSSGSFEYSYPLPSAASVLGDSPQFGLSYSSASVDGMTAGDNSQASEEGIGWTLDSPYIEREYRSCSTDGHPSLGDLCWNGHHYKIVMNGHASRLVPDPSISDGEGYRLQDDPGWIVTRHWSSGTNNGDNNGEYFQVRTTEGDRYFFGRTAYETGGSNATDSVLTVPVYGDDAGEPCNASTLSNSWCMQAWRWNLATVLPAASHTAITYSYSKETNNYQRYGTTPTAYDRAGRLISVDYSATYNGSWQTGAPTARSRFFYMRRCAEIANSDPIPDSASCPALLTSNASSYPDVPLDLRCTSSSSCAQRSPSFWSTWLLQKAMALRLPSSGSVPVDEVRLGYTFPSNTDGTSPHLWLSQIGRSGYTADGTQESIPTISTHGELLANRVDFDTSQGEAPMNKYRLQRIGNEFGGRTEIQYGQPSGDTCTAANLPTQWDTNERACFRRWWTPADAPGEWAVFNKYVTTQVQDFNPFPAGDIDSSTGSATRTTTYTYEGDAGWVKPYAPTAEAAHVSYSEWRGYGQVVTDTRMDADFRGGATSRLTRATDLYFRGMDDKELADGTHQAYQVVSSNGVAAWDWYHLGGRLREHIDQVYDGSDWVEETGSWHGYSTYRTVQAGTDEDLHRDAKLVKESSTVDREAVPTGTRRSSTYRSYSSLGQLLTERDTGDDVTGSCTTYDYGIASDSLDGGFIDFPTKATTREDTCDSGSTLLARQTTYYDDEASATGQSVARGLPTTVVTAATGTHDVTTTASYSYGRVVDSTDRNGNHTWITYTGDDARNPNITTKNALQQEATVELDRYRLQPETTTDLNDNVTQRWYDPLGRLTAAALPGETQATASHTFAYDLTRSGPSRITASLRQPDGSYLSSYTFTDALGQPRQTQTVAPGSTTASPLVRVVNTRYNENGQVIGASQPAVTGGTAGSAMLDIPLANLNESRTFWDEVGRPQTVIFYGQGTENWRTTTTYNQSSTVTTPPHGGVPVTVDIDAFGRRTTRTEGSGATQASTEYGYDALGRLTSTTDPATTHTSSISYDLLGRAVQTTDPDAGTTTTSYDDAGNVTTVTRQADGSQLNTTYDALNRPLQTQGRHASSDPWTTLVDRAYDDTTIDNGIGKIASTTTHDGSDQYATTVDGYTSHGLPESTTVTIPAIGGLTAPQNYTTTFTYDSADRLATMSYPAAGGLAAETVTTTYDTLGLVDTLTGADDYVTATTYLGQGGIASRTLGASPNPITRSYSTETDTQRLANVTTTVGSTTIQDDTLSWDDAGNLTHQVDTLTGTRTCHTYDGLNRLAHSWTTTATGCDHSDTTTAAGPAGYNTSWAYSDDGNITSVRRGTTTNSYSYGDAAHPHAVTAAGGTSYGYDDLGRQTTRTPATGDATTLAWDLLGHLEATTTGGDDTEFVHDANGTRLARFAPGGTATVYIGAQEVDLKNGFETTARRYYSSGGAVVAVRTPTDLIWQLNDRQSGVDLQVTDGTATVARAYYDPYGAPRTGTATLATDKGWLGKTTDPTTGLTQLGARYYDTSLAKFLTTDPLNDQRTTQTPNPYTYSANNPVAYSDPSGLLLDAGNGACNRCTSVKTVNGVPYTNTSPSTTTTRQKPPVQQPKPPTFSDGFKEGAGDELADIAKAFTDPVQTAKNMVGAVLSDPLGLLKDLLQSAIHWDEINALREAISNGDEHDIGYALGQIVVSLSVDLIIALVTAGAGALVAKGAATIARSARGVETAANGGTVRHYTTSGAAESIMKGGSIEPGLKSGKIWVTPDRYASGAEARAKLALDKTPDGYFEIPMCRVKCPTAPSPVAPWNGQPGGGIEITTEFGIDIRGLIFRTFG